MRIETDCFYLKELLSPFSNFTSFVIRHDTDKDELRLFSLADDKARLFISVVNKDKMNYSKGEKEKVDYLVDARKIMKYLKHIKSEEKVALEIDERVHIKTKDISKKVGLLGIEAEYNIKKEDYPYDCMLECKTDIFEGFDFVAIDSNEVVIKKEGKIIYLENVDEVEKTCSDISKYVKIVEDKKDKFESIYFVAYITEVGKFITDDFVMKVGENLPLSFEFWQKEKIARCKYVIAPLVVE